MYNTKYYGLPHGEWRPGQAEMIEQVAASRKKWVLVRAPTGSGKTSLPAALAIYGRTVALVRTKELQASNYADGYNFQVLFGRDNYPCAHPKKVGLSAAHCLHPNKMSECPQASACAYLSARDAALRTNKASYNYAYYQVAGHKQEPPSFLVLDEGHNLSDITLEWAGCSISPREIELYRLPQAPFIKGIGGSMLSRQETPTKRAIDYLGECARQMARWIAAIENDLDIAKDASARTKAEVFAMKIASTLTAFQINKDQWFISSGPAALPGGEFGFFAKPLTAKTHFPTFFGNAEKVVIMSATMAFDTFAEELGLTDYDTIDVPGVWPAETRPVWDLEAPRIGMKSTEVDAIQWARVIARAIDQQPPDWSGLVHVTSKSRAFDLARRLRELTPRPIFTANPQQGTNLQIAEWNNFRDRLCGAINVTWNLAEGYDGTEERINIIAKAPFPDISSLYEQERQRANGKFYLQRAAWITEQEAGRVRRGRPEDYDKPGEPAAFVAIADGNWKKFQKYLSPDFFESIRRMK